MCGIFGAVGHNVETDAVKSVLQVLKHRGPNGSGVFGDELTRVTLAHTRLSVIDLVGGAQPLQSEDGNLTLVAAGEIYEFERIRASLEAKGYRFRTASDSEVVIHLYQEFGLRCFEHLRGEFAFLLYDRSTRLLIAARDRFGIKPLYFSKTSDGFVFASEMKAIFASGLAAPTLDPSGLDPFLEQDPEQVRFPFAGIEHVPPASYMVVDVDTCSSSLARYWSPEIPAAAAQPHGEPIAESAGKAAQLVLEELDEAVRLRLRADVPVGLYLSGGINSAFVGALMNRHHESQIHSFSISFPGSARNEEAFARRTAEFLGTAHHELAVTKDMLWDHLEDCLWFSELPFVTLAPVGKFLLSEEARKWVTVVLTGEGADEVFLGYRRYFERAIRETRRTQRTATAASSGARRLKLTPIAGFVSEKLSLLMFRRSVRKTVSAARRNAALRPSPPTPIVNAVQEARIAGMPLDILCYLGDREEMAHSIEARLPFLDHKLYDVAKAIPVDLKMRNGMEKAVLRDAAQGILPDDVRLRRKRGFMMTSDPIDFFGADRKVLDRLRPYLSQHAFDRAQVFSYRAYLAISLLARLPNWKRLPVLKRVRQHSNKVIMYMMQTHMLDAMFISDPPWTRACSRATPVACPQSN